MNSAAVHPWTNTLYNVHTGFDEDYPAPRSVTANLFADDTQFNDRCSLSGTDDLAVRFSACADEILNWMRQTDFN